MSCVFINICRVYTTCFIHNLYSQTKDISNLKATPAERQCTVAVDQNNEFDRFWPLCIMYELKGKFRIVQLDVRLFLTLKVFYGPGETVTHYFFGFL